MKNYSVRDKSDLGSGLALADARSNSITTYMYQMNIDTRDCVSSSSLENAQIAYELSGGVGEVSGNVINTTGVDISPIVITMSPLSEVLKLKNMDKIIVKDVYGNTAANGTHIISNINYVNGTASLLYTRGNGNFAGRGFFTRPPDPGYPIQNEYTSIIRGPTMTIRINGVLKNIREMIVDYATIPRDIIPIETYITDLVDESTNLEYTTYTDVTNNWSTFIPQEAKYIIERSVGFYSTPIDIFRSYQGAFSLQDSVSPTPLLLWNPPIGPWPLQPLPYPYQTVPTYQSNDFTIPNTTIKCHIVLAGYGLYDMNDWTSNTGVPITDAGITSIVRKLLLLLITPIQSYNDYDYINMILACNTVTPDDYVYPFGYGDFQRFVPGPGLQLNYQPGTSDNADPRVANSTDWPIPFPNFIGNVYGPYDSPEGRFQKIGLRSTLQDLFLNGDTNNLLGNPIIKPSVPTKDLMNDGTFGLNYNAFQSIEFNNIAAASNLNILNAMRIVPNGFGALSVRALGSTNGYNVNKFQYSSGQGPSNITESTWKNHNIENSLTGTLNDPIAIGPSNSNNVPANSDPNITIQNRTAWYDLGANNGQFITQLNNYIGFTINDIPDSDIVMYIDEALRNERSLSTNTSNVNANLIIPMRLNLGTPSGTIQYIESVYSLLAGSSYWSKRFLTPKTSLNELHISFKTYEGTFINLEKMLQPRKSSQFLQLFSNIISNNINIIPNLTNFNFYFLFDPFNPKLIGRMKRYIQLLLKFECYEYVQVGLIPDIIGEKRLTLLNEIDDNHLNFNDSNDDDFVEEEEYNNYS